MSLTHSDSQFSAATRDIADAGTISGTREKWQSGGDPSLRRDRMLAIVGGLFIICSPFDPSGQSRAMAQAIARPYRDRRDIKQHMRSAPVISQPAPV